MKTFFSRNIDRPGRVLRGLCALGLLAGAAFAWRISPWLTLVLALAGVFVLFEALRGWCVLRACGIKTRL